MNQKSSELTLTNFKSFLHGTLDLRSFSKKKCQVFYYMNVSCINYWNIPYGFSKSVCLVFHGLRSVCLCMSSLRRVCISSSCPGFRLRLAAWFGKLTGSIDYNFKWVQKRHKKTSNSEILDKISASMIAIKWGATPWPPWFKPSSLQIELPSVAVGERGCSVGTKWYRS